MSSENDSQGMKRVRLSSPKSYIVQTPKFRCMAYRDDAGIWHDYFDGDEIKGDLRIISEA